MNPLVTGDIQMGGTFAIPNNIILGPNNYSFPEFEGSNNTVTIHWTRMTTIPIHKIGDTPKEQRYNYHGLHMGGNNWKTLKNYMERIMAGERIVIGWYCCNAIGDELTITEAPMISSVLP